MAEREPARGVLAAVRAGLDEPLRIAVAGRVNAGKSTLVNALLGQRVAPTDVSECTRYVTCYRHGVPERLEVVGRDGRRHRSALLVDGSLPRSPSELGDVGPVERLDVFLANDALGNLVLIDTPGLGSLTDGYSAATLDLLAQGGATERLVAGVDGLVLVLTAALRSDEAEVIRGFREALEASTSSALGALCVLNKADLLIDDDQPGEVGSLAPAEALAQQFAGSLRDVVSTVVPVISLLAETVDTGRFTEGHANTVRAIAALPDATRRSLLMSADRFASADVPIPAGDRTALLGVLGLYGVEAAAAAAADGRGTAVAIAADLRSRSGFDRVRDVLLGAFARNADALKAAGALAALERLCYSMNDPADAVLRGDLHDEIDAVRIDPSMHRLLELRAQREVVAGVVELPTDLTDELFALTDGLTPAARLGLDPGVTVGEFQRAAADAAARWKRFRNDGRAGADQRWVADVMVRSCEQLWEMEGAPR